MFPQQQWVMANATPRKGVEHSHSTVHAQRSFDDHAYQTAAETEGSNISDYSPHANSDAVCVTPLEGSGRNNAS